MRVALVGFAPESVAILPDRVDRDPFDRPGLAPQDLRLALLRSKTRLRAVRQALAAAIVIMGTPDWGTADLRSLPWRRVRPGVLPLDAAA